MECENSVVGHLTGPYGGGQDKDIACASLLGIGTEFLGLPCRLGAATSDDDDVLEAVVVEGATSEGDGLLAFVMREVLGLAVAALDDDASDTALERWMTGGVWRGQDGIPLRAGGRGPLWRGRRSPRSRQRRELRGRRCQEGEGETLGRDGHGGGLIKRAGSQMIAPSHNVLHSSTPSGTPPVCHSPTGTPLRVLPSPSPCAPHLLLVP